MGALDRPSTGEVRFEGKNLSEFSDRDLALLRREKVGFIFQTFNLLPSLTVFENIESGLVRPVIPRDQLHGKIRELLDVLELTEMSNRLPLELSVGQQQKVAVARAIIKNPALILADEPTGEMDAIAGKEIIEKLIDLTRKGRVTLIIASHGTSMVSDADRSLFIKSGRIVSREELGY